MTWLDHAIGWVSPRAGLRRVRARAAMQLLEGQKRLYEGANVGRRNDGWMTGGSDANAEIGAANARLRMRARDLVRNNAYAAKAVQSLTANVIGGGIVPRADDRTDELWARWADTADAAGNTDFYGLQSLILRTMAESGSCLVRRRIRRPEDGLAIPLQLQVLEPDHLDTSRDIALLTNGGTIEQGIEFDADRPAGGLLALSASSGRAEPDWSRRVRVQAYSGRRSAAHLRCDAARADQWCDVVRASNR